jgi:hypothetical protein
MALADLTKQLAQQAILSATEKPEKPAAPDQVGAILLGQIHAMQKALKEDEELVIWFENSAGKIRIMEIFFPSWKLAVLSGHDSDRNLTRVISPIESVQLVAKVMKAPAGAKPTRVGLVAPKPGVG